MNPLEDQLVAYYYGEADDPAAVEKLLADDPAARLLYEELSAVLAELRPPNRRSARRTTRAGCGNDCNGGWRSHGCTSAGGSS